MFCIRIFLKVFLTNRKLQWDEHLSTYHNLTPRERIILKHITYGQSNKEITAELHITEKTVKTHITSIFGKMKDQDYT
ncbi:response regulator transcription factor [Oceanobacillus jeddahense]|uniref:LuxR C-terminal-related transcriptional regulator n=1 Tax=Oceanobacillus jeddahense TaxID=1462527 RepID=A0ABY5K1M3_9BACI|nr:LuxR C-terminal-related transcriptional regulator [Oceanobacillus jeddahense]UUI05562.1 LuxR C-terminal-related transcriptional regulator [Oceanobacillus jeddahense]